MSGGSFNYLFRQEQYDPDDLRLMAEELESRGMDDAARATRALMPRRAPDNLARLWQAIEWHRSMDWSEAQVARAFIEYEKAELRKLNPPG